METTERFAISHDFSLKIVASYLDTGRLFHSKLINRGKLQMSALLFAGHARSDIIVIL